MSAPLSVGVVGGGIGGLTAALAMLDAGLDVHVYEQARELREVGAGIQVSPNASRILHGLGLADELAALGVRPLAFHQRRWDDGRTLLRAPLGDAVVEAFGYPHYQMHRADLLATLVKALPADRIHVGHRLTSLTDHGDRVSLAFDRGETVEVDLAVGADGIHSSVRDSLVGPQSPHFTGCVAYRGLVPAKRVKSLEIPVEAQVWMGPGKHFVHYFVQNKELLNFVAIFEQDTWTRESWTDAGEVADAIGAFDGWHPQLHAILAAVDETFVWALFDREPLERWSRGRVTLLGDACHAMLPFFAQGAAQAIEDGAALAACVAAASDVPAGLRRYESVRRPRATRIQAISAQNKSRFHLPDGPDQEARDQAMATRSTDFSIQAVGWVYGHDARIVEGGQV
jgi:2-polyprenyl-6-methoxyphenol hydroxylase-like FAD-dependent oxidoreductase